MSGRCAVMRIGNIYADWKYLCRLETEGRCADVIEVGRYAEVIEVGRYAEVIESHQSLINYETISATTCR
jgi:hypothetical protein